MFRRETPRHCRGGGTVGREDVELSLWGVVEGVGIAQPGEGISSGAPYSNASAAVRRLLRRQLWALDADVL